MEALAELTHAPDKLYAAGLTAGLVLFGSLPHYGWWNRGVKGSSACHTPENLFAAAAARRRAGEIPTSASHLEALWADIDYAVERAWWSRCVAQALLCCFPRVCACVCV